MGTAESCAVSVKTPGGFSAQLPGPSACCPAAVGRQLLGATPAEASPAHHALCGPPERRALGLSQDGRVWGAAPFREREGVGHTDGRESLGRTPRHLGPPPAWGHLPLALWRGTSHPAHLASSYSSVQWGSSLPAL